MRVRSTFNVRSHLIESLWPNAKWKWLNEEVGRARSGTILCNWQLRLIQWRWEFSFKHILSSIQLPFISPAFSLDAIELIIKLSLCRANELCDEKGAERRRERMNIIRGMDLLNTTLFIVNRSIFVRVWVYVAAVISMSCMFWFSAVFYTLSLSLSPCNRFPIRKSRLTTNDNQFQLRLFIIVTYRLQWH